MRRSKEPWGALLLVVVGVVVLILWKDSVTSNSTAGVTVVGDNVARLPQGEEFVLTHSVGKSSQTWHITYDGAQTVHFDQDGLFGQGRTGTLCGVGCTASVDMGFLESDMKITLRNDGAVDVKWPWGWNYRPYKS